MYQDAVVYVFLGITKIADFQWKHPNAGGTQGVCLVIHMFLDLF